MKCVVCNTDFSLRARCHRDDCPKGNLETPETRFRRAQRQWENYDGAEPPDRVANFMCGFGLALLIGIIVLFFINSHARALDHGFSDLPQPHSPEMTWVETRVMPGEEPRRSSCCGKGDMYYADIYTRNADGSYDAVITDGSEITYPDGDHRAFIANGTKFHIKREAVNPPEDGNALGHGVVFLGVDKTGDVNKVANVWCFFPLPLGS